MGVCSFTRCLKSKTWKAPFKLQDRFLFLTRIIVGRLRTTLHFSRDGCTTVRCNSKVSVFEIFVVPTRAAIDWGFLFLKVHQSENRILILILIFMTVTE